jgi:mono/diheme cytochrome c family protein
MTSMNKTRALLWLAILAAIVFSAGCRYDMQDQPRLKSFKQSDFFPNQMGSRQPVAGTVARGYLREDKALYTGKKDEVSTEPQQTVTDAAGNTYVSTFPNDIDYFPVPVNQELVDRGQDRFKIYCSVCHGPLGDGDGMIVQRGFSKPPSYHDDRLRNAPVGHFFDVATNGSGKMNGYASQIPVADRWAIVAYIRTLQISRNPNGMKPAQTGPNANNANLPANHPPVTANGNGAANTAVKPTSNNANNATNSRLNSNGGAH